jgi:hypothetical protein
MTAGPAQQVPDRQAGHPGGHRELGARVTTGRVTLSRVSQGNSHVRHSTGTPSAARGAEVEGARHLIVTIGPEVKINDVWLVMQWDLSAVLKSQFAD